MVHVKNQPNTVLDVTNEDILSYSKNGIVATSYRDDSIVAGNAFANETIRTVATGATTQFFVLDPTACTGSVFKLPISVNPSTGVVKVKLYEGTNFVGGTALSFINRNRNSDITQKSSLKESDSVETAATVNILNEANGFSLTADTVGLGGNEYSIAIVIGEVDAGSETVVVTDKAILVTINEASTIAQVVTALNAESDVTDVLTIAAIGTQTGSMGEIEETFLAGAIGKGELLFYKLFGTLATRQDAGGGQGSSADALVLNTSKKYLFEVYNEEACDIGYNMEVIEL